MQRRKSWHAHICRRAAAASFQRTPGKSCMPHARISRKYTGRQLDDNYFTQTLLPAYIEENGVDWNVVYDARGHFAEPHTNRRLGCGTIEVGNYLHAAIEPEV